MYQFCQNKLKTLTNGRLKISRLLTRLHNEYNFGTVSNGYLYFTEADRMALIERVRFENGIHLLRDSYPETRSRSQVAHSQRNEKVGSFAVSQDFILVNSLHTIKVNQQEDPISSVTSLGVYINADEITSIEHTYIVFVENLHIMSNLALLDIPEILQEALWVYRGDIKTQQSTGSAYQFFRRFRDSNQLVCFSDLDPKGIEIAMTCDAHYWLTAEDSKAVSIALQGHEYEWFVQMKAIKYLQKKSDLPKKCKAAFLEMCDNRKTLKQEHMLEHNIKLDLYEL